MDGIQTDSFTQFTSKEIQEGLYVHGARPALAATDHQKINGQVEVTWQTLRTITFSIMVHAQVYEKYIHFAIMYTNDHIFPVISIRHLVNQNGEPTTPHKLATTIKPATSNPRVLLCPYVV